MAVWTWLCRSVSRASSEGSIKSSWAVELRQCENKECGAEQQGGGARAWDEEEEEHDMHACGNTTLPQHDNDMDVDKNGTTPVLC